MSTVLICRDALEDAVLGNIALARAMAQRGDEVALVFTGEALAALDKGTFRWSPNFKTRDARSAVIAAAEAFGLPLAHGDLDSRWSDVRGLVRSMATRRTSGSWRVPCGAASWTWTRIWATWTASMRDSSWTF